jgi:prephenate dehydratase
MLLGYLGPRTNSEIAAKKYAASVAGLGLYPCRSIEEVFRALNDKLVGLIFSVNSSVGEIIRLW